MTPNTTTGAGEDNATPVAIVRPSWSDPSYALASSYVVVRVVDCPAGEVTEIVPGDPRRWCLHVSIEAPAAGENWIQTRPVAQAYGIASVGPTPRAKLSLFEDGPLVALPIYCYSPFGCTLEIVETLTQ